ncbi:MAG TPA: TonB-dependent receptor [Xanthobacteraceae bacterium]|nr:TonB-dependent receptor [Xanthobacteraceae bacterium]
MSRKALLSSIALSSLVWCTGAYAQSSPSATDTPAPGAETPPPEANVDPEPVQPVEEPAAGANVQESGEIVVTGSRIARQDYVSTSPLVTVGQETLARNPSINIESTLNQLPQFVQGQNQSAIGAVANGGRATLNLRGLGETRNLILLNGRRLPLSSAFSVVDINNIPPNIIDNIETISGGASAVYGSDAMSGVVNFITRRSFDGVQIDARGGMSDRGDAETMDIALLAGTGTANDRGRAMISVSYSDRNVLWGSDRPDFFSLGVLSSFIGQGTIVVAGNAPSQAAYNTLFATYGIAPGTVLNSRNLGFNDDGTLFSQIGAFNYRGPTTGLFSTFGGTVRQPVTMQEYIVQPMTRWNVFAQASYDFTDAIEGYTQILHTDSKVTGQVGWSPTLFNANITVPVTNPFLPAALLPLLASRPTPAAPFVLNSRFMGFEDRKFIADTNLTQFVLGLRGNLGFSNWKWDVYGSHDTVDLVETQDAALLSSRMQQLLNAPDGGRSLCAGGFNPFGLANQLSVSEQCRDYISTETHDVTKTKQSVLEGNLTGALFALPGGDVQFSATATYRKNSFTYDPDPAREGGDIIGTLASVPSQGKTNVKELGLELLIPLLKERPFVHNAEINLGYRISDYNVTGKVDTYRVEGLWSPIKPLLFRGGYEKATRSPNIGELYSSAQTAQVQIGSPPQGDPCDSRSPSRTAQIIALCVATGVPAGIINGFQYTTVAVGSVTSGSTDLTPEDADTITFGAVLTSPFQSPWASGLSASVDYYNIKIKDVISQVAAVTTLNKCYNLDGSNSNYDANNVFCSQIIRDPTTGFITFVATPYLNLGGLRTSGIDVQADWRLNFADTLGIPGRLHLNTVVNFLRSYKVQVQPDGPFVQYRNTIDGTQAATTPPAGLPLPKWKSFTNLNYSYGPATLGFRWRHLPKMRDVTSVTRPATPAPGVPKYDIFDANLALDLFKKHRIVVGVTNIFDKDPPVVGGTLGQTQPGTYDIIGRSFYASVTARF